MESLKASISFLSKGSYRHPFGFREKNWIVSQSLCFALSTILENPPAMEI